MKVFCLKVALFLAVQGFLFGLAWNPELPWETNYLAATIDKHRLLAWTRPPRILLVGGSGMALGINSGLLETALDRPVVNMALVARLGIPFMLNEVEGEVCRGDVVVLSFEPDIFVGTGDELTMRQLLGFRPASFRFVPVAKWKRFITDYGLPILGSVARRSVLDRFEADRFPPIGAAYDRRGFDAHGCYTAHYTRRLTLASLPAANPERAAVRFPRMTDATRRRIARFSRTCQQRGAQCVYTCAPYPRELMQVTLATENANAARLAAIPHLRLLDWPRDQTYPMPEFFDSRFHLTRAGGREHTRRLIRELRPLIGRPPG